MMSDVNRQHQWDTLGTKVNRHLGACSETNKAVDYATKEGVSHGTTDFG
jgi:hypothetical protein